MFFSTIHDVDRFLKSLPAFQVHGAAAAKPGLERIRQLCEFMGNPECRVPAIHIAGTNGKGSVSAMLALAYEAAGYKCGLYTSPHLNHVSERIRINKIPISESGMLRFFQQFGQQAIDIELSFFEITTAMAFWWFSDQNADISIIETGLGGRLDATNIVNPEVSVITSIALDHQDFLGSTYAEIAREKGGIIKQGRPVVIGNVPEAARKELEQIAERQGASVSDIRRMRPRCLRDAENSQGSVFRFLEDGRYALIRTDLRAPVHRWNVAAARAAMAAIAQKFPLSLKVFQSALSTAGQSGLLQGRFEKIHPVFPWFFDGAHNPEAVRILVDTIKRQEWEDSPVIVLSVMKDKAQKKMLKPFSLFEKNYYYRLEMERAANIALITPFIANLIHLPPQEDEIISKLKGFTKDVVIFTGSFYFYSVVKRWISRIIKAE